MNVRRHIISSLVLALGLGAVMQGCLDRPIDTIEPRLTSTITKDLGEDRVDKIDILLTIDDSGSMADKQVILSEAIPRLVESLVNPDCVPDDAESTAAPTPPVDGACAEGTHRRFDPINDIHVGVISSSVPVANSAELGVSCDGDVQLLAAGVPTYDESGFLAWDPLGQKTPTGQDSSSALRSDLSSMVTGVGQTGCAYEQPLESWYRFLVDPDVDSQRILGQRAKFLRPDSLLAIVMLTDENDCSIDPRAGFDPAGVDGRTNLACFDQADKLYPASRYIEGLTSPTVLNAAGDRVGNPLYAQTRRKVENVLLTGIVGVPWQKLARDPGNLAKGLMNAAELDASGTWDEVLGDPAEGVQPSDPHMVESELPRQGLPDKDGPLDPVHGHEHTVGNQGIGELQYACTFALPESFHRTCDSSTQSCDCKVPDDRSVCRQDDGTYSNRQVSAKAYPGLRQLEVMRGLRDQAIVASICASQLDDDGGADYGYQPAIGALVDRLADKLAAPCLSRELRPNTQGQVSCLVIEATQSQGGSCSCDGGGRFDVPANHMPAVNDAQSQPGVTESGFDCFCELDQLEDAELDACQNHPSTQTEVNGEPVNGWCYTDENIGNPDIVETCEPTQKRIIRLMGDAEPSPGSRLFITCTQEG